MASYWLRDDKFSKLLCQLWSLWICFCYKNPFCDTHSRHLWSITKLYHVYLLDEILNSSDLLYYVTAFARKFPYSCIVSKCLPRCTSLFASNSQLVLQILYSQYTDSSCNPLFYKNCLWFKYLANNSDDCNILIVAGNTIITLLSYYANLQLSHC